MSANESLLTSMSEYVPATYLVREEQEGGGKRKGRCGGGYSMSVEGWGGVEERE